MWGVGVDMGRGQRQARRASFVPQFGVALVLGLATVPAHAGGFGVREQSAEFLGTAFAGNAAAGGGLSGMYWNPAVAAYAPVGLYSESHYAGTFSGAEISGNVYSGGVNQGLPRDSGDMGGDRFSGASYMSWRLSDRLVAAVSFNTPFAVSTEPANRYWAGQTFARTTDIQAYSLNPTLAYRLTPAIAVAVGLQAQHIEGRFKSASDTSVSSPNTVVQGDDTAFGFTAGVDIRLAEKTHIGLGYRSAIEHSLEGTVSTPGSANPVAAAGAGMRAGLSLPEIVTLSARHALSDRLTLLGTVEWTNWSRADKLDVACANNTTGGNAVFCPAGNGQLVSSLPLGWNDGWYFSVGGEYQYSDRLKLRSGIAYEVSPIRSADERLLRVPDMDRVWASIGATYKWSEQFSFDLAYAHGFGIGDDTIDRTENGLRFIGSLESQVDIVSASMKVKFGGGDDYREALK